MSNSCQRKPEVSQRSKKRLSRWKQGSLQTPMPLRVRCAEKKQSIEAIQQISRNRAKAEERIETIATAPGYGL